MLLLLWVVIVVVRLTLVGLVLLVFVSEVHLHEASSAATAVHHAVLRRLSLVEHRKRVRRCLGYR